MAAKLTSRRKVMVSGFLTLICCGIKTDGFAGDALPEWLGPLISNLKGLSSWIRMETMDEGIVIHCGAGNFPSWASRAGALAGRGQKVLARGNTLSFHLSGNPVRIVMHLETV